MTAKVDAVVYFRIADPIAAILKAENAKDSTFRISQSTLRDVLGTRTLAEILAERDVISEQLGVSVWWVDELELVIIYKHLIVSYLSSSFFSVRLSGLVY